MNCIYCKERCIKSGIRKGKQRYFCKICGKYQQEEYAKPRITEKIYNYVKSLNNEGCGISSIGRLLHIAKSSVQRVIERLAKKIKRQTFSETGQSYEMDELRTFCKNKENELWLIYAINRKTKRVIDFCVGRRTTENIKKVVTKVLNLNPPVRRSMLI